MQQLAPNVVYAPGKGFIILSLPKLSLPATFVYDNIVFEAKQELHVSLIGARNIALEHDVSEEEIIKVVKHFLAHNNVSFEKYTGEFYRCQKDEAQTIVARAYMNGLEGLYDELRQLPKLSALPSPVPHVTLYKYNHQFGIAIPNEEVLTELCAPTSSIAIEKLTEMITSAI